MFYSLYEHYLNSVGTAIFLQYPPSKNLTAEEWTVDKGKEKGRRQLYTCILNDVAFKFNQHLIHHWLLRDPLKVAPAVSSGVYFSGYFNTFN